MRLAHAPPREETGEHGDQTAEPQREPWARAGSTLTPPTVTWLFVIASNSEPRPPEMNGPIVSDSNSDTRTTV